MTNAKGFVSKRGKYDGGTFAHPDIAPKLTETQKQFAYVYEDVCKYENGMMNPSKDNSVVLK